jgi:diguanylate cyclase
LPSGELERVSQRLEDQLSDIVRFISHYLEANLGQSEGIAHVQSVLSKADTLDQVRHAVQLLVKVNAQASLDAEHLRNNLRDAKKQTEALRTQLSLAQRLAATDGLTSVANRRHFDEVLSRKVHQSHLERTPLSLVLADLDHFKNVNDRYGHPTGDAVLKAFAALISETARSGDLVARFGGEEFAIVLPNTPVGNASFLVERIQRAMARIAWRSADSRHDIGNVTASFGIAEIREDETGDSLIKRTDRMLYNAKKNGRNRYEIDSVGPSSSSAG